MNLQALCKRWDYIYTVWVGQSPHTHMHTHTLQKWLWPTRGLHVLLPCPLVGKQFIFLCSLKRKVISKCNPSRPVAKKLLQSLLCINQRRLRWMHSHTVRRIIFALCPSGTGRGGHTIIITALPQFTAPRTLSDKNEMGWEIRQLNRARRKQLWREGEIK